MPFALLIPLEIRIFRIFCQFESSYTVRTLPRTETLVPLICVPSASYVEIKSSIFSEVSIDPEKLTSTVFRFEILISMMANSPFAGILNDFSPANAASCFLDKPSFRPCHATDKLRALFVMPIFLMKNFHTVPEAPCSHCTE